MFLMKVILMLTAGMLGRFVIPPSDQGTDEDVATVTVKVAECTTADENGDPHVFLVGSAALSGEDDDDDAAHRVVLQKVISRDDSDDSDDAAGRVVALLEQVGSGVQEGGPWLGIQFGPVPKPLAAQLNLDEGVGQMVLNVIEDSPADQAGFQQYDVIIGIDDEDAPVGIAGFLDVVKGFDPGESHAFTLFRGGQQTRTTLTVGSRPSDAGRSGYKYEVELEDLSQDKTFLHGGILRKDDLGHWKLDHLGNFKGFGALHRQFPSEDVFKHLFEWTGKLPGAECNLTIETGEGESVKIVKEDGKITVTRTVVQDNGDEKTTTKTYADEDDLEQDDPQAYELLHRGHGFRFFTGKNGRDAHLFLGEDSPLVPHLEDLDINLDEILENAAKAREEAMQGREKVLEELKERLESNKGLFSDHHGFFFAGKARTSFQIDRDGKITVTTRRGPEELVQTFEDAEALKEACSDLYKKYERLQTQSGETTLKK